MVGGRLHEPVDEEALVVDHCGPGWRTKSDCDPDSYVGSDFHIGPFHPHWWQL